LGKVGREVRVETFQQVPVNMAEGEAGLVFNKTPAYKPLLAVTMALSAPSALSGALAVAIRRTPRTSNSLMKYI
jgi:hypothetical protein